jgi:multidrug transporter EmrE-like cation transporter
MTISLWAMVFASVSLSAVAQILLKLGMTSAAVQSALSSAPPLSTWLTIASNWHVLSGLMCYGASVLMWLKVLSKIELSLAYPLVSIGFVLVALMSRLYLGEVISTNRAGGILLIVFGVMLMGRG